MIKLNTIISDSDNANPELIEDWDETPQLHIPRDAKTNDTFAKTHK